MEDMKRDVTWWSEYFLQTIVGVAGLLAAGGRGQGPGGRGGHAAAQVAPPLQRTFGFVTLQARRL